MSIRHWVSLTLGRTAAADDRQRRLTGIVQSVISGLASRVIGVVVSFISVPLTIGYLGAERYGVWITIGTLLAWLALADFGLGNGLTNALATAYGNNRADLARTYVTTSLVMMTSITLLIGVGCAFAWPWIDWNAVFNVHTAAAQAEVGPAMAAALLVFLASFPLSLIGKVFTAYQEGRIANYWGAAGNVASLIALLVVSRTQGGLVWLVVAVSGTGLLMSALSGIWLFVWHKPFLIPHARAIKPFVIKELGHVGGMFFVIQIAWLLIFQTDNLIIAHFAGAAAVTPYSVTYRLFNYTALLQTLIFPNLWAAYTEAIARKDIAWVSRTFRGNVTLGTLSTAALAAPLIFVATPFIHVWAGDAAIPPFGLIVWMAAWSVINASMSAISCLQSASARIKNQMFYALATAATNIGLSLALIQVWGITGVIAGTVISYIVCDIVPSVIDVQFLLRKLTRESQGVPVGAPLVLQSEGAPSL